MEAVRISTAGKRLNCSASWLRSLERQGRIPTARRDAFGGRTYTDADLLLLEKLGVGKGKKLRTIEEVLESAQ
jgi:DNA-binding transcriptional MerR regulator